MHLHLNPLGGLAGDMFCAALLDARPDLLAGVRESVAALAMPVPVNLDLLPAGGELSGSRFRVSPCSDPPTRPRHMHHRDIRALLDRAALDPAVRSRALAVFQRLAEAEAQVHGVDPDEVHFHEVGSWDSIADIVSAATLLEAMAIDSVSTDPLPLGGGRVRTAHGILPVPAPATRLLLEGLPVSDDGISGERVTPTGAAILASLHLVSRPASGRLSGSGMGFGTRELPDIPNCLQVLCIDTQAETEAFQPERDRVAVLRFEIDDQNPEDFAQAMDHLRGSDGVLSVTCLQGIGKQGRPTMAVEILCRPERLQATAEACFRETTTIGLRWQYQERFKLARRQGKLHTAAGELEIKRVQRPQGPTAKLESRSLRKVTGHAERTRLRSLARDPLEDADHD